MRSNEHDEIYLFQEAHILFKDFVNSGKFGMVKIS